VSARPGVAIVTPCKLDYDPALGELGGGSKAPSAVPARSAQTENPAPQRAREAPPLHPPPPARRRVETPSGMGTLRACGAGRLYEVHQFSDVSHETAMRHSRPVHLPRPQFTCVYFGSGPAVTRRWWAEAFSKHVQCALRSGAGGRTKRPAVRNWQHVASPTFGRGGTGAVFTGVADESRRMAQVCIGEQKSLWAFPGVVISRRGPNACERSDCRNQPNRAAFFLFFFFLSRPPGGSGADGRIPSDSPR